MSNQQDLRLARVAAFVAAVNSSCREPKPLDCVPQRCRLPLAGRRGYCDWQIVPVTEDPAWRDWHHGPYPWPLSFHILITRYQFPAFSCGPLEFYPVGLGSDNPDELRNARVRDPALVSVLWEHGYLPFARPEDGSYDPICFQCAAGEPAVVRLDHEEVLCRSRIPVPQVLSPSFEQLLEEMTAHLLSGKATVA